MSIIAELQPDEAIRFGNNVLSETYKMWRSNRQEAERIVETESKKIFADKLLEFDEAEINSLILGDKNSVLWGLKFEQVVVLATYLFGSYNKRVLDNFPGDIVEKLLESYRRECVEHGVNENNRNGLRLVFGAISERHDKLTTSGGMGIIYDMGVLKPNRGVSYIDDEPEKKVLIDLDPEVKWIMKPLLFDSVRSISMSESAEAWYLIKSYFGIEGVYEALTEIYKGDPKPWETVTVGDQVNMVMSYGKKHWIEGKGLSWNQQDIKLKRECLELINSKIEQIRKYRQEEVLITTVGSFVEELDEDEQEALPIDWRKYRNSGVISERTLFGDYFYIEKIKKGLPEERWRELEEVVERINRKNEIAFAINSMYVNDHTRNILVNDQDLELAKTMQNEDVMKLIELVWDIPEQQHLIAKWSAIVPANLWSVELKDKLAEEITDSDIELKFRRLDWVLCNRAEDKLWQSINLGLTMLIDKKLLLKGSGKMSALCLESFTTRNGFRFIKGCWYSPDEDCQHRYKEGFVLGETSMKIENGESWILMRGIGHARHYGDVDSNTKSVLGNSSLFLRIVNNYVDEGLPNKDRVLNNDERKGYFKETYEDMNV